ncbi:MAG: ABC transporter substrate-binding protein [Candidatus Brocadiaceae bacterium]|nr:ABC transporter substrate-binding protein [Candidatus Brocadiaceae bacterium]
MILVKKKQILLISVYIFVGLWIISTFFKPEKKDEIVFSIGAGTKEIGFIEELVAEFERENPAIQVKLNVISSPTDQQHHYYLTTLGAKTENIDVMRIDTIWLAEFASARWIEPLDAFITGEDRASFIPVTEKTNVYEGYLYAIPWNINVGLLYYRKDLLEKYGFSPPDTWEECIDICRKITPRENLYGYLWQGKQYEGLVCNFIEFIGGNNGRIIDENGATVVHSVQNKRALDLMRDLIWKFKISPPNTYSELMEESSRHLFQQGKGLFLRNWTYVWDLCQEDPFMAGRVGVTQLPRFPEGAHSSVCGGWHLAVNAYSKKKEKAWRLIKFLSSGKTQKKLALNLAWAPTKQLLYKDPELIKQAPLLSIVEKSLRNVQVRPNLPYYQWISDSVQKQINKALSDQKTSQEALQAIYSKMERIQDDFRKN